MVTLELSSRNCNEYLFFCQFNLFDGVLHKKFRILIKSQAYLDRRCQRRYRQNMARVEKWSYSNIGIIIQGFGLKMLMGKFFETEKHIVVSKSKKFVNIHPFCDVNDPQNGPKWPKIGLNLDKSSLNNGFSL